MIDPGTPQLAISHICDAPPELVYRAFTDPEHLAAWWGPVGNALPSDEIRFDVRPGGYLRWTEINAAKPELRVHVLIDLTNVVPDGLLEGVMHVTGRLPEGVEPFQSRLRIEFHDEPNGRTRLEIRQWVPEHLTEPSTQGWAEALAKLDSTFAGDAPTGEKHTP